MYKKIAIALGILLLPVLISTACSNINAAQNIVEFGQEFVLPIGQSVSLSGDGMIIRFDSVETDSRSPVGVQTIWAGKAKCNLVITDNGNDAQIVLTEKGLTDEYSTAPFGTHEISFKLLPYPKADVQPAAEDYELIMTVFEN